MKEEWVFVSYETSLLSPAQFEMLKNKAYGESFIDRFGLQLEYKYFFREDKIVQLYLFAGTVFSYIGFADKACPTLETRVFLELFTIDLFPGIGLKTKLWENIYLNQSVSPGILYINFHPFNSFSLNPMYKIGLAYRF
ncbi:MAG: hypothetical protein L3J35_10695 [Bacteroidales bacterium]|nr:hypothetical protein [Bacteroidales bacterium]